jgi:hypothetical protein
MKLTLRRLARIAVLPVVLGFWWGNAGHPIALASDPHFHAVGEPADTFWNAGETACTHWIAIVAQQIRHPDGSINDGLPYSLQLVSVKNTLTGTNVPLVVSLPRRIAGGTGAPILARGLVIILFRQTVPAGTPLTIEVDRWDHGNNNAVDDTGDKSGGDDQFVISDSVSPSCSSLPTPS